MSADRRSLGGETGADRRSPGGGTGTDRRSSAGESGPLQRLAGVVETTGTANRIRVRLTPRSSRDAIEGVEVLSDGTAVFAARVRAVPEKGAANAALEGLVAKTLGVARTRVSVVSGSTSRIKTVAIEGDAEMVARRLAELAGPA